MENFPKYDLPKCDEDCSDPLHDMPPQVLEAMTRVQQSTQGMKRKYVAVDLTAESDDDFPDAMVVDMVQRSTPTCGLSSGIDFFILPLSLGINESAGPSQAKTRGQLDQVEVLSDPLSCPHCNFKTTFPSGTD